jgi:hypothetical protein
MLLVWILVALLAFVLLLVGGGHLLPATWSGTVRGEIPAAPERVWAVAHGAAGPGNVPVPLAGQARSVERLPDAEGRPSWVEDLGSTRHTVVTETWEPPRAATRRVIDAEAPVSMRTTLALEPTPAGTTSATVSMEIEIATTSWHGPLMRWMMLLVGGGKRPAAGYLRRLTGAAAGVSG